MHQSFVTTTHTPTGKGGDSRAKVRGKYLFSWPAVQGKLWGFDIKILTPGRFSIVKGRAKGMDLTSVCPLKTEVTILALPCRCGSRDYK